MSFPAPVVFFAYRRPVRTEKTLRALARNTGAADTRLVVFSDAAAEEEDEAAVTETRRRLRRVTGFRSVRVVERESHLGLARSVLGGVEEVVAAFGRAIVVEDDVETHPWFLRYMNGALESYAHDARIMSVTASSLPTLWQGFPRDYPHDVWLSPRVLSHGWGVWADRWQAVDWQVHDIAEFASDPAAQAAFNQGGADLSDALLRWHREQQDLWAVRFTYAHFAQGRYTLAPVRGYARHAGHDGKGANARWNPLRRAIRIRHASEYPVFPKDLQPDPRMADALRRVYRRQKRLEPFADMLAKPRK